MVIVVCVLGMSGLRAGSEYLMPPWRVDTWAGYTGVGSADGPAASATFNEPSGLALGPAGKLYIADTRNSTIRVLTTAGMVETLTGQAGVDGFRDGALAVAKFNLPFGLVVASDGTIFVSDTDSHRIRRITTAGQVGTLAGFVGQKGATDGTGSNARFNSPTAIVYHETSGLLYVADTFNNTIRRINVATGVVTTLAGDASKPGSTLNAHGASARFNEPVALALSSDGALLYVAEQAGQVIRCVVTATGEATTLAGLAGTPGSADGSGGVARFDEPKGLALDGAGHLYVADSNGCRIRRVTLAPSVMVETLAGGYLAAGSVDGIGAAARLNQPAGLAYDATNNRLLVADVLNAQIRALNLTTLNVTTLAGVAQSAGAINGVGEAARFSAPRQLARDAAGNIYVADRDSHTLRKITPAGVVTALAGLAGAAGTVDGTGTAARFNHPVGVAVKPDGSLVYVSEESSHVVRKVTAAGVVTTLAGQVGVEGSADGAGVSASFHTPAGLALDAAGNLYVADFNNNRIRKVTPAGVVTTFAGSQQGLPGSTDGTGTNARFSQPSGVAVDGAGNVFVADFLNQTVRKITPGGVVSTLAGLACDSGSDDAETGAGSRFFYPDGLTVDTAGRVYVADYGNHLIRRIELSGAVVTIAGTANISGGNNGVANAARFRSPRGVVVAPDGETLYIADTGNNAIRKAYPAPVSVITSPLSASGTVGQAFAVYTVTGSRSPIYYNAVGLPAGMMIDQLTGVISGSPLFAGVYSVTLQVENVGGIGSAVATFTIAKANATIALSNLERPYDGTPKSPTATTFPENLAVAFTFNDSSALPSAFGTYSLRAVINDPNFQGEAIASFDITAPTAWSVTTLGGFGSSLVSPAAVVFAGDGTLYVADAGANVILRRTPAGVVSVFVSAAAGLNGPSGLAFDSAGNLYVADSGNNLIRRVTSSGVVTTVAGGGIPQNDETLRDGFGTDAIFYQPMGLALGSDGALYVADNGNVDIRRILLSTKEVMTISMVPLKMPSDLAFASDGTLYVLAQESNNLWRLAANGSATLVAGDDYAGYSGTTDGTGSDARFYNPRGLAIAADGNLYVADSFNHTLRHVTPAGVVTTVAGLAGESDNADGTGSNAHFSGPSGLAFGPDGKLYIADTENSLIRVATPPPSVPVFNPPPAVSLTEGAAPSGYVFSASGSPTTYSATGLPPGLTLNPSTGALTGAPTASGIYSVVLSATNSLTTTHITVELTINAPTWETWRQKAFNVAQLANPAVSAPGADPDGDGVPNLLEYLQDRDPLVRSDANPVGITQTEGHLGLVYEHLRAAPAWRIVPEYSTDLTTWHRGTGYIETVSTTVIDARRQRVEVRVAPAQSAEQKKFLRLHLEPNP